ncbi:VWA domain-containing protein [Blastococcus sp. CT_GayMR16]|uniref:vWA domain-containing protein n=1 Tax=Blastococcus sp. CT_GayMR16 TaxID=2559607 RepID=UPI0010745952|nr:VWA domain-containing protein [Blastococcus sp. CT_GayMR16]TFV88847.1 VWA domain-containing protein [Blastococcus sp. CT_GayMR16]
MLTAVEGLIAELRATGVPVSVSSAIDAARSLEHVDVLDRRAVQVALRSVLVKTTDHLPTFDTVFDLFFGLRAPDAEDGEAAEDAGLPGGGGGGGGGLDDLDDLALREVLLRAMRSDDSTLVRAIAGLYVERHAALVPGQPVAGTFNLFRTMRAIDAEGLVTRLVTEAPAGADHLHARLVVEQSEARVEGLRLAVEGEIRRRLVADRGAEAVARTLRTPLPEDVDFLTASREQVDALREVLRPLSRALAARLAERRRHKRRGHLDFRRTVRNAMSTGGVPVTPVFRAPHPAKPRLVVLADISGSVATFAGFTLQLVHALRSEFSSVRSFAFVDGVDEVTALIEESDDIADAGRRINAAGAGVWLDGRSDYGNAMATFADRWAEELTRRTTVLILGDARGNYHDPQEKSLAAIRRRAGALHWLNPEQAAAWDSGDSVIGRYAPYCDTVVECRNLRQLRAFVEQLA